MLRNLRPVVAQFKSELQLINADEPTVSVVLRLLDPTL